MRVSDAMRKVPATIDGSATIRDAAQLMDKAAVGALIVLDGERPVGIVTDRDIVVRVIAPGAPLDGRVDAVMSGDLVTIDADADLRECLPIFDSHPYRRIPVVEAGKAIGMITVDDLLVDVADDFAHLVRPVASQVIFGHPEPRAAIVPR